MGIPDNHESSDSAITKIESILVEEGVRGALKWLNSFVMHRYTGIYVKDGDIFHNMYLFDKLNPAIHAFDDVSSSETYCEVVVTTGKSMAIVNAKADGRVRGHPACDAVRSYCGTPLRNEQEQCFGTICHFDEAPSSVDDNVLRILESASSAIALQLRRIHPHLA